MKNGGRPQGGRHDYVGSVVVVGRRIKGLWSKRVEKVKGVSRALQRSGGLGEGAY
jgi:hypothetical protein